MRDRNRKEQREKTKAIVDETGGTMLPRESRGKATSLPLIEKKGTRRGREQHGSNQCMTSVKGADESHETG